MFPLEIRCDESTKLLHSPVATLTGRVSAGVQDTTNSFKRHVLPESKTYNLAVRCRELVDGICQYFSTLLGKNGIVHTVFTVIAPIPLSIEHHRSFATVMNVDGGVSNGRDEISSKIVGLRLRSDDLLCCLPNGFTCVRVISENPMGNTPSLFENFLPFISGYTVANKSLAHSVVEARLVENSPTMDKKFVNDVG